jgi:hypothetical protein
VTTGPNGKVATGPVQRPSRGFWRDHAVLALAAAYFANTTARDQEQAA